MLRSYKAKEVCIGSLYMGGDHPVVIQSMTNTDTLDIRATAEQVKRLGAAGCALVRITTPTREHVYALEKIKNTLHKEACFLPLVADVHFLPEVALAAAQIVEKVRINPGNYVDKACGKIAYSLEEHSQAKRRTAERIAPLLEVCKKHHTVLRLGVNQGSVSERMVVAHGHTPKALVCSALEFIDLCEDQQFYDLVVSLKSSSVKRMREAVLMMVQQMQLRPRAYPLHLGVTEAGSGLDGRLISAVGIGGLLKAGIGDTIRVSLTEDPEAEIPVAQRILYWAQQLSKSEVPFSVENVPEEEYGLVAAVAYGESMMQGKEGFSLPACLWEESRQQMLWKDLYQAAEAKFYKTRIIACPSCGRTLYNIQEVLEKVKQRFSHYQGITIAVMGCVVNGPGEMADADYGYIGSGNALVNLYKKGVLVAHHLPEDQALEALEKLILSDR